MPLIRSQHAKGVKQHANEHLWGGRVICFRDFLQFCPPSPMTSWKEGTEGRERSPWGGEEQGTEGDAEVDARV